MSTSIAEVTCADVSSERRMCSAMPRRIAVTGSTCSPACASAAATGAGAGFAGAGAGAGAGACCGAGAAGAAGAAATGSGCGAGAASGAGAGCAGGPLSMKPRMSFFVTRPPAPVPGTWLGSTPCSDAMRATTGETNVLPLPLAAAAAAGVGAARRAAARRAAPAAPSA